MSADASSPGEAGRTPDSADAIRTFRITRPVSGFGGGLTIEQTRGPELAPGDTMLAWGGTGADQPFDPGEIGGWGRDVDTIGTEIVLRWEDDMVHRFRRQADGLWTLKISGGGFPDAEHPVITGYRRGDVQRVLDTCLAGTPPGVAGAVKPTGVAEPPEPDGEIVVTEHITEATRDVPGGTLWIKLDTRDAAALLPLGAISPDTPCRLCGARSPAHYCEPQVKAQMRLAAEISSALSILKATGVAPPLDIGADADGPSDEDHPARIWASSVADCEYEVSDAFRGTEGFVEYVRVDRLPTPGPLAPHPAPEKSQPELLDLTLALAEAFRLYASIVGTGAHPYEIEKALVRAGTAHGEAAEVRMVLERATGLHVKKMMRERGIMREEDQSIEAKLLDGFFGGSETASRFAQVVDFAERHDALFAIHRHPGEAPPVRYTVLLVWEGGMALGRGETANDALLDAVQTATVADEPTEELRRRVVAGLAEQTPSAQPREDDMARRPVEEPQQREWQVTFQSPHSEAERIVRVERFDRDTPLDAVRRARELNADLANWESTDLHVLPASDQPEPDRNPGDPERGYDLIGWARRFFRRDR